MKNTEIKTMTKRQEAKAEQKAQNDRLQIIYKIELKLSYQLFLKNPELVADHERQKIERILQTCHLTPDYWELTEEEILFTLKAIREKEEQGFSPPVKIKQMAISLPAIKQSTEKSEEQKTIQRIKKAPAAFSSEGKRKDILTKVQNVFTKNPNAKISEKWLEQELADLKRGPMAIPMR